MRAISSGRRLSACDAACTTMSSSGVTAAHAAALDRLGGMRDSDVCSRDDRATRRPSVRGTAAGDPWKLPYGAAGGRPPGGAPPCLPPTPAARGSDAELQTASCSHTGSTGMATPEDRSSMACSWRPTSCAAAAAAAAAEVSAGEVELPGDAGPPPWAAAAAEVPVPEPAPMPSGPVPFFSLEPGGEGGPEGAPLPPPDLATAAAVAAAASAMVAGVAGPAAAPIAGPVPPPPAAPPTPPTAAPSGPGMRPPQAE